MQFRFDANQEYQLQAVEAVTDLVKVQERIEMEHIPHTIDGVLVEAWLGTGTFGPS